IGIVRVHSPLQDKWRLLTITTGSSRSPPLFACQRSPLGTPQAARSLPPRRVADLICYTFDAGASREEPRAHGLDLATTYCPTQLPTQYRRRRGVSRPCSGRERVGPPREDTRPKARASAEC